MSPSCTISKILSLIYQNFKKSCDCKDDPFGDSLSHIGYSTRQCDLRVNLHTDIELPSFARYKDTKNKNLKYG